MKETQVNTSWAEALPSKQGLYNPELEKNACGVGFMVHVKGERSHKILSDANDVLCNMTHRGASGADIRDGDGAGIMTGIPHQYFVNETSRELGITLPQEGQYAVGNLFMKDVEECQMIFEKLADALDLKVLGWRRVPVDSTIIGPPAIYPPRCSTFKSEENVIVGNVCLYGATSGKAFFRGMAAERFCVRNSGAIAVCEGLGDHGCEYMTGGRAIVLGKTGRNFAAGMSGGIAYVLDVNGNFHDLVNTELVDLETVNDDERIAELRGLIEDHRHYTGSEIANRVLKNFNEYLPKFVMVMPVEYGQLLKKQREEAKNAVKEVKSCKQEHKKAEPPVEDVEDSILNEEEILARHEKLDKLRGFMKYKRKADPYRNAKKRIGDWDEVNVRLSRSQLHEQAARCMDCSVPFCQSDTGCPIGNIIPKWNELVYKDNWKEALDRLMMTNNFPEFTGRVW